MSVKRTEKLAALAIAFTTGMALAGCSATPADTGVSSIASPTEGQSAEARLDEAAAVSTCGDAVYLWYPFGQVDDDPTYFDSWNWRFDGSTREVAQLDGEWRIVFANTASSRPDMRQDAQIEIDGVQQDGHADTWCQTNPDGTFDVGIIDGASVEGKTLEELSAYLQEHTNEQMAALNAG